MNLNVLNEFIALAQHASFSNAAKDLFISQPTLSSHIKALESEIGCQLIERDGGVRLTPAGEVFLAGAQDIIDSYRKLVAECQAVREKGKVLRARDTTACRALKELSLDFPLKIVDPGEGTPLFKMFEENMVDVAVWEDFRNDARLMTKAESLGLACFPFESYRCHIVASKEHPLAAMEKVTPADLAEVPIYVTKGHADTWRAVISRIFSPYFIPITRLAPWVGGQELFYSDLRNGVILSPVGFVEHYFGQRSDLAIIDDVEGVDMTVKNLFVYRKNDADENLTRLIDRLKLLDVNTE